MLELIFTDRDVVCAIKQDVGSHEDWVIKNANIGRAVAVMAFFLVLSHAECFPHGSVAIENPAEFGVGWDIRLTINMNIGI